jgi:F1F0 ATPase subunit 2
MNETTTAILAMLAGVVVGTFFFGGLWWTVRRGLSSKRPAIVFLGSMLLRIAGALAGFYFVSQGDWRKLLACLLGFMASRLLIARIFGTPFEKKVQDAGGGGT